MFAEQNVPSAISTRASAKTANGSVSMPTTPRTLSILSPSASDVDDHAAYLRDKYGIPVLMADYDEDDAFLDTYQAAFRQ